MANGKPSSPSYPALPQHELRRLAVAANCDPRSIVRYLREGPMVSTTVARIEVALRACGYDRYVRDESSPFAPLGEQVKRREQA